MQPIRRDTPVASLAKLVGVLAPLFQPPETPWTPTSIAHPLHSKHTAGHAGKARTATTASSPQKFPKQFVTQANVRLTRRGVTSVKHKSQKSKDDQAAWPAGSWRLHTQGGRYTMWSTGAHLLEACRCGHQQTLSCCCDTRPARHCAWLTSRLTARVNPLPQTRRHGFFLDNSRLISTHAAAPAARMASSGRER